MLNKWAYIGYLNGVIGTNQVSAQATHLIAVQKLNLRTILNLKLAWIYLNGKQ